MRPGFLSQKKFLTQLKETIFPTQSLEELRFSIVCKLKRLAARYFLCGSFRSFSPIMQLRKSWPELLMYLAELLKREAQSLKDKRSNWEQTISRGSVLLRAAQGTERGMLGLIKQTD
jgi:hypothetical protein